MPHLKYVLLFIGALKDKTLQIIQLSSTDDKKINKKKQYKDIAIETSI